MSRDSSYSRFLRFYALLYRLLYSIKYLFTSWCRSEILFKLFANIFPAICTVNYPFSPGALTNSTAKVSSFLCQASIAIKFLRVYGRFKVIFLSQLHIKLMSLFIAIFLCRDVSQAFCAIQPTVGNMLFICQL